MALIGIMHVRTEVITLSACEGGIIIACKLYNFVTIVRLRRLAQPKDLVGRRDE